MTGDMPQSRENSEPLTVGSSPVRAGFRILSDEPLAGGPVELEFFVENLGKEQLWIAVSGDRSGQRPGHMSFEATFGGQRLEDPHASGSDFGGPLGVVPLVPDTPWHQPVLLNQFIRLEQTPGLLPPGAAGRLDLRCRRTLTIATTEAKALVSDDPPILSVELTFDLQRDDEALKALIASALAEVTDGQPALRERPLAALLAMRSLARNEIEVLTHHPGQIVAKRARQAQASLPS